MKTILTTMTVLALCMGLSGCLYPVRDWRGNSQGNQYGQGYQNRGNWYGQGHQDRSDRDCFSRDGRWYCRAN
jgi:hypothetical protein